MHKKRYLHIITVLFYFLFSFPAICQEVSSDNTFNPSDIGLYDGNGFQGSVISRFATQPDGKTLVAGAFNRYNSLEKHDIVRLNVDRTIDNSFNVPLQGFDNDIYGIIVQPDGKIVVGGTFTTYGATSSKYIIRLNSDGSVDNTFNVGTGFNADVRGLEAQPDGKILAIGYFTSYNGTSSNRIIRLNSDGTIDNTFNIGTGFDNNATYAVALQSDGKILVGGFFTSYNGTSINRIARLNSNGSLDNTFNVGTGANATVSSINIQSDGKILVGGEFTSYNGTSSNYIIRLNTNGSHDNTFNIGTGFNRNISTMKLQSDGKILVGGGFLSYNGISNRGIIRLNSNGSQDNTFNTGRGFDEFVSSFHLLSDGKIFVGGNFRIYNNVGRKKIVLLNSDGTVVNEFVPSGTGFNDVVKKIVSLPDGKFLVVGDFTHYNNTSTNFIVKVNNDGSIDNTFNTGTGFNHVVETASVQPDGKILVGGQFTNYNGSAKNRIVRLNSDGSIDNTFNMGTGFTSNFICQIYSIGLQSDGKILATGNFGFYNGNAMRDIVRINADGTFDNTFNTGNYGLSGPGYSIIVHPTGKILVGGQFGQYNFISKNGIVCLNSNGSIDNTFNMGTGFSGSPRTIAIQSDGKVLVGGQLLGYNGTSISGLVRLNINGTIDNTFDTGSGISGFVNDIKMQSDGKILIGGQFSNYKGQSRNSIVRILSNGDIDESINTNNGGANGFINSIIDLPSDKFLIAGQFSTFNGNIGRNHIAKLFICQGVVINPSSLPDATINNSYSQTLSQTGLTGSTLTWSLYASSLPSGLTLSSTGVISGTPTSLGTFNFTVRVTDGFCYGLKNYSINIICPVASITTASLSDGVVGTAYNQTLNQTGLSGTITWAVLGLLPNGLIINTNTGVISGTPTTVGTFNFTVRARGNGPCDATKIFSISITCPVSDITTPSLPNGVVGTAYNEILSQTGLLGTVTWGVTTGSLPNGLIFSNIGTISGVPTTTGTFNFTVQASGTGVCTASKSYTIVISCPTAGISPSTFNNGIIGTAYNQTLNQTGLSGTITWGITAGNLPNGLTLNPNTGIITGNTTQAGTFNFTVQASGNGICTVSKSYTIIISCRSDLAINPSSLVNGVTGTNYSQALNQTGLTGVVIWSVTAGSLPNGLTLNPNTGIITGVPTAEGTFTFTIQASSAGCSVSKEYSISVNPLAFMKDLNAQVSLYPNPSDRFINLKIEGKERGSFVVNVNDIFGRTIFSSEVDIQTHHYLMELDLKEFPAGMYMIQVIHEQSQKVLRFVKQ